MSELDRLLNLFSFKDYRDGVKLEYRAGIICRIDTREVINVDEVVRDVNILKENTESEKINELEQRVNELEEYEGIVEQIRGIV